MDYTNLAFFNGILLSIKWLYFLPGDLLVSCLSNTEIGQFYEFSNADRGGVFSFFVPWFLLAILMASINDTKSGKIILFNKGKKTFTKNGRSRVKLLFVLLFILISIYFALESINIKNSWIDLSFIILISFLSWYAILTSGYSFKQKKFKKGKHILTKTGKRYIVKPLSFLAVLLILYLTSRFVNYSCSFIIFIIPILFIVFYFCIGNRWLKLKKGTIKIYNKIKTLFKR
jgi:hypothetical protein